MTDILPPGDAPAWADSDAASTIAQTWQQDMWPSLWPRMVHEYATAGARDADLAGLAPTDVAFAWIAATKQVTAWDGTGWVPIAGKMPRATGTLAATVSVGDAAWSGVAWVMSTTDAATFEIVGGTIKCKVAGEVTVTATGLFAASPDGSVYLRITKNGSPIRSNSADQDRVVSVHGSFSVAVNDIITVQVFHNSGGSRNVGGDASQMAWDLTLRGMA